MSCFVSSIDTEPPPDGPNPTFLNFFTFFDAEIGNEDLMVDAGEGVGPGTISSGTPYVRVQGSGNGFYDVYAFDVTTDALTPKDVTSGVSGIPDGLTYYTKARLDLVGDVERETQA